MNAIVTFHDGINFGAYLQVYALQKTLEGLGMENEVINYKNPVHWKKEYRYFLFQRNPFFLVSNIQKILKFRKAQGKLKRTSFSKDASVFKAKKYDNIFFGSDEIWNFQLPFFGKDLFYFGQGLNACRFIAYSVSFGNLSKDVQVPQDIISLINNFSKISVRDDNSALILHNLTGIHPVITLDPTLLYDFNGQEETCPYKDFIMVYTPGFTAETERAVKNYALKKGLPLISVGYRNRFCDINRIPLSPFEFLGYCKGAAEIITNMFHGTIFSLKYRKNFCLIPDPYRVNKLSFLRKLKLEGRILKNQNHISEIMEMNINFDQVDQMLAPEKKSSIDFIRASGAPS